MERMRKTTAGRAAAALAMSLLLAAAIGLAGCGSGSEEDASTSEEGSEETAEASTEGSFAADGITCEWQQVETWETDGEQYAKIELALSNDSGAAVAGWTLSVTFADDVQLSDSWNGVYEADGATLVIENESYNGDVEDGASTDDIGFIVYGDELPAIEGIEIEAA